MTLTSLRRRAWAFQGPSRLSTHGHAFIHTQTCTNSIPFTPGVQACVPCVHKHRPCLNNTQICTHMHTHTRMHLHKSAPGTCQPLTLPSQGHYPSLFPLPGRHLPRHLPGSLPHLLTQRSPRPSLAALQWTLRCPIRPLAFSLGCHQDEMEKEPMQHDPSTTSGQGAGNPLHSRPQS